MGSGCVWLFSHRYCRRPLGVSGETPAAKCSLRKHFRSTRGGDSHPTNCTNKKAAHWVGCFVLWGQCCGIPTGSRLVWLFLHRCCRRPLGVSGETPAGKCSLRKHFRSTRGGDSHPTNRTNKKAAHWVGCFVLWGQCCGIPTGSRLVWLFLHRCCRRPLGVSGETPAGKCSLRKHFRSTRGGDSHPTNWTNKKAAHWAAFLFGGARRDRTADLLRARQALSQLSYGPEKLFRC
jgi:hypothetical protein